MSIKITKKFFQRFLSGAAATFVLVSFTRCSKKDDENISENTVGYKNFSMFSPNIDEENFVILDVGNHQRTGVSSQDKKMKYCNEHDISLGFVIASDAKDIEDIYNDVELAKGIITEHHIDMPVYLGIDKIIENDSLNLEVKSDLINRFLQKCSRNGICVGVYGSATNLTLLKEYCSVDLTDYDTFLVMDKKNITYDGAYSIIEDLDGNVKANRDLSKTIIEKGLNTTSKFANDGSYTVEYNDNIQEIAMKFGFSVNDLLGFNDLKKSEVKPGTKLRIPSIVEKNKLINEIEFQILDEPQLGIDLSRYQGTDIDWDKLASNVSYIIFKVNQGNLVDSCFYENSQKCSEYNIPMGGYCYNAWLGFDASTGKRLYSDAQFKILQEKQADKFIETVKERDLIFPAYLDFELASGLSTKQVLSNEQVKIMLDVWHDKMSEEGYIPGLYCNKSMYSELSEVYGSELNEKFELWIAGGSQYIGDESKNFTEDEIIVPTSSTISYNGISYVADTLQVTNCGYGFGAGNGAGHVDVNFNFTDYTTSIFTNTTSTECFPIKEFERSNNSGLIITGTALALGVGVTTAGVLIKKKRNKRL